MARGIAVRSIVIGGDGRIEVAFSAGSPTAPAGQSGSAVYGSQTQLQDAIKEFEASLTDQQLLLLHLAITWLKSDGTFNNTNQVTNKELRLDTTAASVIRIV